MCGITGFFSIGRERLSKSEFAVFNNSLSHRGPDYGSIKEIENEVKFLGHRRLSILDLTEKALQPMSRGKEGIYGEYSIVFNGEIYNFLEIKEKLIKRGHHFRSDSDTEVLLLSYIEWGEACQNLFNGMWAIAIYNSNNNSLFLSRDRFGVKPLYYYLHNGFIAFASEVKSFMKLPKRIRPSINSKLINYLAKPHEQNKYRLIKSQIIGLAAGHKLIINREGKVRIDKWWKTEDNLVEINYSYSQQVQQFKELFFDACRIRLRSDTRVGCSLSGGLDSSSVVSTINNIDYKNKLERREAEDWKNAFIFDFKDSDNSEYNYARLLASEVNFNPNVVSLKKDDSRITPEAIRKCIFHSESPNQLSLAQYFLYGEMRHKGIYVTIDGHGADEMLCGYSSYLKPSLIDSLFIKNKIGSFDDLKQVWNGYYSDGVMETEAPLAIPSKENLYKELGLNQSLNYTYENKRWTKLKRSLFNSFHHGSLQRILNTYDKIPMAHGVEVRSPFLDWRVVTYLFSLPNSSIIGNGYTKRILRDAMYGIVPNKLRLRKSKRGFGIPYESWLNGSMKDYVFDVINSKHYLENIFFNGREKSKVIKSSYAKEDYSSVRSQWATIQIVELHRMLLDY